MLRAALIWRYGGFYSDSDIICMKNTENFVNVLDCVNDDLVKNGVMHGQVHHDFFWKLMEEINATFKVSYYASLQILSVSVSICLSCF